MDYKYITNVVEMKAVYDILSSLDKNYPDFHYWFYNKVVPGVIVNTDKIIAGFHKGNLVGVSIIKKTLSEHKLRALRITPEYQQRGFGLHLIDKSLKELNHSKPLVSVNENMIHDFSRIFINRYDFDLVKVHKNLYKKDTLEYQFNGNKDSLIKTELPY